MSKSTSPVVIDSSGWLEYIAGSVAAAPFRAALKNPELVIVPTIVLYEVTKVVLRERGKELAMEVAAAMQQCVVVDLDSATALEAEQYKLALADSIIYATAQLHGATLHTQDAHFAGLPGVQYHPKPKS